MMSGWCPDFHFQELNQLELEVSSVVDTGLHLNFWQNVAVVMSLMWWCEVWHLSTWSVSLTTATFLQPLAKEVMQAALWLAEKSLMMRALLWLAKACFIEWFYESMFLFHYHWRYSKHEEAQQYGRYTAFWWWTDSSSLPICPPRPPFFDSVLLPWSTQVHSFNCP